MQNDFVIHDTYVTLLIYGKGAYHECLVDPDTFEKLRTIGRTIYAHKAKRDRYFYARFHLNGKTVALHRWLMGFPTSGVVDHENVNSLDNRKHNLRIVTRKINRENTPHQTFGGYGKSGIRGITWNETRKKWQVFLPKKDGKRKSLGYHTSLDKAKLILEKHKAL